MKEFKGFLEGFAKEIPQKDVEYYDCITKPIYERLITEVEKRFQCIEKVVREGAVDTPQSLLVTGCVDVDDYKKNRIKTMEPILNINEMVSEVVIKENCSEIRLKSGENNYLFSILCDCEYEKYLQLADTEISAKLEDNEGENSDIALVYRQNMQYIEREAEIKKLFITNRPQSSYFDIPICRRILDVFYKGEIEQGMEMILRVQDLPGKVGIPVWNVLSSDSCNGSRKSNCTDKRVLSPYGISGEQNQYVISFENCREKALDALVKIEEYHCNYMFSQYDKKNRILKLYTHDKKVWNEKFCIYQIMDISEEKKYLWDTEIRYYNCLGDFVNAIRLQEIPTEASIYYYVNIFSEMTGLKLKNMKADNSIEGIRLEFLLDNTECRKMIHENKEFLIKQLNKVFLGHRFTGEVVRHG